MTTTAPIPGREESNRENHVRGLKDSIGWAVLAFLLFTGLPLAGCGSSLPKAQQLERYRPLLSRPLADRIVPADEAVIERAHRTNLDYGQDIRPRPVSSEHPVAEITRRVLASLPEPVARLTRQHLVAVYLIEGDVGTATTELVGRKGAPWRHTYIALNVTSLTRRANDWATWKERSTFLPPPGEGGEAPINNGPRMVIEPPETDDLESSVRFILLHELGHVIGVGQQVHPPWEPDGAPAPKGGYPYRLLSWKPNREGGMDSRTRETQPLPHQTGFYTFDKAPLRIQQAQEVYAELENTNFPSLYGASNHYDDFAEAFVIDVHTRLLGKPYRVDILQDGEVVGVYRSCLQRGDCPGKASFLRQLLGESG